MERQEFVTTLIVSSRSYQINLRIGGEPGPAGKRARRMLAHMIYREIKKLIPISFGELSHEDGIRYFEALPPQLDLSFVQTPKVKTRAQRLGVRIRKRRLDLGWTQEQLAKQAGMTVWHLSKVEHGKHRVRPELLSKLWKALRFKEALDEITSHKFPE